MVLTLGLQAPCRAPFTVPRKQVSIRCNYVPDYSSPDPENLGGFFGKQPRQRTNRLPIKKFWEYQAPSADIGSPDGYELKPVGIPEYGDGGNNGGRGGRGGGGRGGGGGGDPMKGFTYLFAILLFGAGLMAYFKKGSSTSLMISSAMSVMLLVSASLMGNPTYRVGTFLALATCMILASVMGKRSKESGKLIPAGLVAGLSGLMCVGYIATLI
ncbi:hypothetical protein Ndes2526B_g07153 [Nannochloris sp. 'desiccata']|nr:hypothetical protein KSW81_004802 [Chlorella desiccata (nom. nud.)]KAH7618230.1 hypothetical protein NADE_000426 [Chlorella desiccata (nom. nud.)]